MAIGTFWDWNTVSENRRKARAEEAVHTALKQWCSDEPLDQVRDTKSGDFFDEFGSRMAMAPRPTTYQVSGFSWVRGGTYSVYRVSVTLSFVGGSETRQYEVEVSKKSGKCFIKTTASEDISGTESHARTVLQAWLDNWVVIYHFGGTMQLVITCTDWVKADKATRPTPRQRLKKEAFGAVDRPLTEGDIDREAFRDVFDTPDEADLATVEVEDDGTVWLRVTFSNSVDLRLSELQLPQEVQDRVVAQIEQLVPPKRNNGRSSTTTMTSE